MEKIYSNFMKKAIIAIIIVFMVFLSFLSGLTNQKLKVNVYASSGELEIHYIDVGQGDCAIIKLPDGKTMIVDAGDKGNAVRDKILGYIETNFSDIENFDYAIVTHSDADHCGSMDNVLAAYPAKTVYRPNVIASDDGYTDPAIAVTQDTEVNDTNLKFWNNSGASATGLNHCDTLAYSQFIAQAYKPFVIDEVTITPKVIISDGRQETRQSGKILQDIIVDLNGDGDIQDGGEYSIIFYAPLNFYYNDVNDYSNIFVIKYQGFEFLFTGDAEAEAEAEFVEEYIDSEIEFDIDVFKLGHHGSRTSSSQEFIDIVTEQSKRDEIKWIISCGLDNSYSHPHTETLDRFLASGFLEENKRITITDKDILFEVKKNENDIYTLYEPNEEHIFDKIVAFVENYFVLLINGDIETMAYSLGSGGIIILILVFIIVKSQKGKSKNKRK